MTNPPGYIPLKVLCRRVAFDCSHWVQVHVQYLQAQQNRTMFGWGLNPTLDRTPTIVAVAREQFDTTAIAHNRHHLI